MTKPRRHAPGMNTHHGQTKDRENWNKSMRIRKSLIEQAQSLNIKLTRPHEMKIADLQNLIDGSVNNASRKNKRKKTQTRNKS